MTTKGLILKLSKFPSNAKVYIATDSLVILTPKSTELHKGVGKACVIINVD